jgi:hypothetical protein
MSWPYFSILKGICFTVPKALLSPIPLHASRSFWQCKAFIMVVLLLIYTIVLSVISDEGKRFIKQDCTDVQQCKEDAKAMLGSCCLVFIVGFLLVLFTVRCPTTCVLDSFNNFLEQNLHYFLFALISATVLLFV